MGFADTRARHSCTGRAPLYMSAFRQKTGGQQPKHTRAAASPSDTTHRLLNISIFCSAAAALPPHGKRAVSTGSVALASAGGVVVPHDVVLSPSKHLSTFDEFEAPVVVKAVFMIVLGTNEPLFRNILI